MLQDAGQRKSLFAQQIARQGVQDFGVMVQQEVSRMDVSDAGAAPDPSDQLVGSSQTGRVFFFFFFNVSIILAPVTWGACCCTGLERQKRKERKIRRGWGGGGGGYCR